MIEIRSGGMYAARTEIASAISYLTASPPGRGEAPTGEAARGVPAGGMESPLRPPFRGEGVLVFYPFLCYIVSVLLTLILNGTFS